MFNYAVSNNNDLFVELNESENDWLMQTYKAHGMNMEVQTGVRHLFIGLTRNNGTGPKSTNSAGFSDGWISGEDAGWRPPYGGQHGEQKKCRWRAYY